MNATIRLTTARLKQVIRVVLTESSSTEERDSASNEAMILMKDYPEIGHDDIIDYLLSSGYSGDAAEAAAASVMTGRSGIGDVR